MKMLIATCLTVFLANVLMGSLSEAATKAQKVQDVQCPQPESSLERDLVLTEGPSVVDGKSPSTCLQRIIEREKKMIDSKEEDRDFLVGYMSSVWKAEYEEIDRPE